MGFLVTFLAGFGEVIALAGGKTAFLATGTAFLVGLAAVTLFAAGGATFLVVFVVDLTNRPFTRAGPAAGFTAWALATGSAAGTGADLVPIRAFIWASISSSSARVVRGPPGRPLRA